ncbi:MAG: hypothetical protein OXE81_02125 [Gammaproteobacteria bacterium]|nr:hypothetical protein [Gammaproteobacteria bacterium]
MSTPAPEYVTKDMLDAAVARIESKISDLNASLTWRFVLLWVAAVAVLKFLPV